MIAISLLRLWVEVRCIRRGSTTYGAWVGAELSFENGRQLLLGEFDVNDRADNLNYFSFSHLEISS